MIHQMPPRACESKPQLERGPAARSSTAGVVPSLEIVRSVRGYVLQRIDHNLQDFDRAIPRGPFGAINSVTAARPALLFDNGPDLVLKV
mgnify:CR=1 FL=1